jgi:hypothetical protein
MLRPYSRELNNLGSFRRRRKLGRATHDAEPNIFRCRRATRFCIGRTIRAATNHLGLAGVRQNLLRHNSAEIVNRPFVFFALALKAANSFQERRSSAQLFDLSTQRRCVLRIRRTGPVV